MKRILSLSFLFLTASFVVGAQLPVKFDKQYKTIYAKDLCKLVASNPDIVLIDVRSPGEFSDTSQYASLNLGHFKAAINIPIDTVQKNVAVLSPYKDKTVVLYCSHSQRSRRVSLLLSQNGFSDFYNLNGGISLISQMSEEEFACKNDLLITNFSYRNVSPGEAMELIRTEPQLVVVDVRPPAIFKSIDSLAENNIGRIKGAINIPYGELKDRLHELSANKNQSILLYSQSGDGDAARSAVELKNNGFSKVYVLQAGLNDFSIKAGASALIEDSPPYHLIDAPGTLSLLKNNKRLAIYDTRPKIEFENKVVGRDSYRNLGNLKNAINLEEKDFNFHKYPKDKNAPLLLYGRGEAFRLARKLSAEGYKNVYVMRGIYDFVSSAFNVQECKEALEYLENHEGLY